jgi:hypothetical protein
MIEMAEHFYGYCDDNATAINCKELKTREEVEEEKQIESGKDGRKIRKRS